MNNPKADAALNLSLSLPESLHEKSTSLSAVLTGSVWEILVLASQDLSFLAKLYPQIEVSMLLENFALLRLPPSLIPTVSALPQILYIEMPHYISFEILSGKRSSCITQVTLPPLSLTGNGVLVGFVDSGIDLTHPDFQDSNGNSRVLFLWDQTRDEDPPDGYLFGTEYNNDQINEALRAGKTLSKDESGHGTAAAGIACGNGNASKGRYRSIAPEAELIVVKMRKNKGLYPRTTELISGIDYCIRKAIEYSQPVVVNISYGGTYGNHEGGSIFEMFIDDCCSTYRCSICIGVGNEGEGRTHYSGQLISGNVLDAELAIGDYEPQISIQIWKRAMDNARIELIAPTGERLVISERNAGVVHHNIKNMRIVSKAYGPGPFYMGEEIYAAIVATSGYITSGIWDIRFTAANVLDGFFNMWLPPVSTLSRATGFLRPSPEYTFTIPGTSRRAICVGANGRAPGSAATFSGRGVNVKSGLMLYAKPDITAPGVNIRIPGNKEKTVTGTSFATPMVTGAAAMLMEWGIVKGNDQYMYGEKLKAYLINGATRVGNVWPDSARGWGELCVAASIPVK